MANARAEADKAAAEIAERFGETEERPRWQLRRMARLMGAAWMLETAEQAAAIYHAEATGSVGPNGHPRTIGGVFFHVSRCRARQGDVARRDYFRCFTDRPRVVRERPAPVRRVETPVPQAKSKPKRQTAVPEVWTARRRV